MAARHMKNLDTKFPSTIKIHYMAQTPKRKKLSGTMKNRRFSYGKMSAQCTKGDDDDFKWLITNSKSIGFKGEKRYVGQQNNPVMPQVFDSQSNRVDLNNFLRQDPPMVAQFKTPNLRINNIASPYRQGELKTHL